jgi:hypothetical protein
MNKKITYTANGSLEKQIKLKKIIPYYLFPNEKYKVNKWYYSFYYNIIFKVTEVNYKKDGELEYAFTKTDDNNYSMISTDIDSTEDFAIYHDKKAIYKKEIINSEESYTGAEIVYWFFINDIDCFNKRYQGFWKYVDRYSKYRISDRDKYFIKARIFNGVYVDCKLIKDISSITQSQKIIKASHGNSDEQYMKNLKDHDMKRMHELHKKDISG